MIAVCALPMVPEDLVSEYPVAVARKPRMPPSNRLLHVQARMQAQILREDLRRLHGIFLCAAVGRHHE